MLPNNLLIKISNTVSEPPEFTEAAQLEAVNIRRGNIESYKDGHKTVRWGLKKGDQLCLPQNDKKWSLFFTKVYVAYT